MNPDIIMGLQKRMTNMEETQKEFQKIIAAFKIDHQVFIRAEVPLKPGIACKVAYNANGVITGVDKLNQSDIPQLGIDKIDGLRTLINEKASSVEVNKLVAALKNIHRKGNTVQSGCKVNIDEHGIVVSVTNLAVEDIPELPISKIKGLQEQFSLIHSSERTEPQLLNEITVNPGSGCKVHFDEHGHVISVSGLEMDDIPAELITKLNVLESKIPNFASQQSVSTLSKSVNNKLDANAPVAPGTFTKVTVDSKGLVTFGSNLDASDLPEIKPENVTGLVKLLSDKADRSEITDINVTLSSLVSSVSKIGDTQKLRSMINAKAESSEVKTLQSKIKELQDQVNTIITSIPGDRIMEQLEMISEELSTLGGRVAVLEQHVLPSDENSRQ